MDFRRFIHRQTIRIALCAGALALLAGLTGPPKGDKPAPKKEVSIKVPSGWILKGSADRFPIVAMTPQADKDGTGTFQATLTVSDDAGTGPVNGEAQEARIAKEVADYQPIERPGEVLLDGMHGVKFGGRFSSDHVQLRSLQYVVAANSRIYTITFTCLASQWNAYQQAVEASINTFTLKH